MTARLLEILESVDDNLQIDFVGLYSQLSWPISSSELAPVLLLGIINNVIRKLVSECPWHVQVTRRRHMQQIPCTALYMVK